MRRQVLNQMRDVWADQGSGGRSRVWGDHDESSAAAGEFLSGVANRWANRTARGPRLGKDAS